MLADFQPETIRFFLLSTHYRRPIDFGEGRLREVETGLSTFYRFFKRFQRVTGGSFYDIVPPPRRTEGDFDPNDDPLLKAVAEHRTRFLDAMDDDFNTGGAVGVLFDLVRRLNKFADDEKLEEVAKRDAAKLAALEQGAKTLRELGATLGLFRKPPTPTTGTSSHTTDASLVRGPDALIPLLLDLLVELRTNARKAKDFASADRIRTRLAELGVTLEDRPGGTEWTLGK